MEASRHPQNQIQGRLRHTQRELIGNTSHQSVDLACRLDKPIFGSLLHVQVPLGHIWPLLWFVRWASNSERYEDVLLEIENKRIPKRLLENPGDETGDESTATRYQHRKRFSRSKNSNQILLLSARS
jgi:hypothetical protein